MGCHLDFNLVHEGEKESVALVLVFHERILLTLGSEIDAFPEFLHIGEVFLPQRIDRGQEGPVDG